jgi:hypothetical protein
VSTMIRTNDKDLNKVLEQVAETPGYRIEGTKDGARILCPDGGTVGVHGTPSDVNVASRVLRELRRHGFEAARETTAARAEQRRLDLVAAERARAEEELERAARRAKVEERNQRMLAQAAGAMRVAEGTLLAEILAPHPFPQTYHVLVGPEAAAAFLERNEGRGSASSYRRLRPHRVKQRAAQMLDDEQPWIHTDQGIGFTHEGVLYNGAHRLHAILETGLTLPFAVATGMPVDAGRGVDSPMTRNAGDDLHDVGFPHALQVAGACVLLFKYDTQPYEHWKRTTVSKPQVLNIAVTIREQLADLPAPAGAEDDGNPYAGFDHLVHRVTGKPGKAAGIVPSSAIALVFLVYRTWTGEHRAKADEFFDRVFIENTGRSEISFAPGDPRWAYREWAHTSRRKDAYIRNARRRRDNDRQLAYGIRAFNAFVVGQPLQELIVREGVMPRLLTPEEAAAKPWRRPTAYVAEELDLAAG